jgi:hypothetical protein
MKVDPSIDAALAQAREHLRGVTSKPPPRSSNRSPIRLRPR